MVVASIDIQGGAVVQLRQGRDLVLTRDDPASLAEEFDRYGETAVIDLDAAMGKGDNLDLIKPLLRKAECRVGGGVRTPERARELVSLGAAKVIAGSQAFRGGGAGGFGVNIPFLEGLVKAVGKERVIIAVDARKAAGGAGGGAGGYEITVDGWRTATGLGLIETARQVEPYAWGLLFTCVDREGSMAGIDLEPVKALREAVSCGLTVAGGITTLEEAEALAALGCDAQIGMALYTGKISLAEAFIRSLNWGKGRRPEGAPLLPVIAQAPDGQVLMTGFADEEAVRETFARGKVCFHSRTRNCLWMKGEHSGNTLALKRLRADCDRDAILAVAEPAGPVCHTGAWSCFGADRRYTWPFLQGIIADRFRNPTPGSYTATLDDTLVREKIMEEAEEVCTAKTHDEVVWEAADLLFFTTALMTREGVTVEEVLAELDRRHKK